jgi:hypothetical protein
MGYPVLWNKSAPLPKQNRQKLNEKLKYLPMENPDGYDGGVHIKDGYPMVMLVGGMCPFDCDM